MTKNDFGKDFHKRNRKLAYSAVGTPDYVAPEVQGKCILYVIQWVTHKLLIGGPWVLFFSKCWWVILPLPLKLPDKLGTKYRIGENTLSFPMMQR